MNDLQRLNLMMPKGGSIEGFQGAYTGTELTLLDNVKTGWYVYSNENIVVDNGQGTTKTWTKKTDMDNNPEYEGWDLIVNGGSISINNGILNITTTGSQSASYLIETNNIDPNATKVLEASVRVNSVSPTNQTSFKGHSLYIADGVRWCKLFLTTDSIYYVSAPSALPVSLGNVDLKTGFRKIRIEFNNTIGANVYVDDIQLGNTIPYTSLFADTNKDNKMLFGDMHTGTDRENANVDYDYIYYNLNLEANPDTSGQLIPSVNNAISEDDLKVLASGALKSHGTDIKRYSGFVSKKVVGTW